MSENLSEEHEEQRQTDHTSDSHSQLIFRIFFAIERHLCVLVSLHLLHVGNVFVPPDTRYRVSTTSSMIFRTLLKIICGTLLLNLRAISTGKKKKKKKNLEFRRRKLSENTLLEQSEEENAVRVELERSSCSIRSSDCSRLPEGRIYYFYLQCRTAVCQFQIQTDTEDSRKQAAENSSATATAETRQSFESIISLGRQVHDGVSSSQCK